MPNPTSRERAIASYRATLSRPREYQKDFGETPVLASEAAAKMIYERIQDTEPLFRTLMAGIEGRLSAIINSKQFRNALAGTEIKDDWIEVQPGQFEREYDVDGNGGLSKEQQEAKNNAEEMVDKLKWCLTALNEAASGVAKEEGIRQSFQLAELLRRKMPNGVPVIEALKTAARQIEKQQPQPYVPKKNKDKQAQPEGINAEPRGGMREDLEPPLEINLQNDPIREAGSLGNDGLIRNEPNGNPPKPTMLNDLYDDLYYLDNRMLLGLDMPKLAPESAVKQPSLKNVKSWSGYLEAMRTAPVPHDPDRKAEHLAKLLMGAYQAGRVTAKSITGGPAPQPKPFTLSRAERYVKQIREEPVFKRLCKDPRLMNELMTQDPKRPHKQFNAMMNMFRPFGNAAPAKSREVLQKLQNMLPYMDPKRGRSSEWKALVDSIERIDLNNPQQSGEAKLQEIYEKNCAYMKGKKSLRSGKSKQNRFDQSMDVLAVLAEAGPYAKLAAEAVVDRVNEVRRGNRQDTVELRSFGQQKIASHANRASLQVKGMDPLPEYSASLPELPETLRTRAIPVSYAAEEIAPLFSPNEITENEAYNALATAFGLATQQVYYDPGTAPDGMRELETKLKLGGRAVVDETKLTNAILTQCADPVLRMMAKKLTQPEARRALLRNGQLDRPPEEAKEGHVKWADKVQKYHFKRLSREEYELRMIRQKIYEPLAPKGEKHLMMQVFPDIRPEGKYVDAPSVDCGRINMDSMKQLYQETKLELQQEQQPAQLGV